MPLSTEDKKKETKEELIARYLIRHRVDKENGCFHCRQKIIHWEDEIVNFLQFYNNAIMKNRKRTCRDKRCVNVAHTKLRSNSPEDARLRKQRAIADGIMKKLKDDKAAIARKVWSDKKRYYESGLADKKKEATPPKGIRAEARKDKLEYTGNWRIK